MVPPNRPAFSAPRAVTSSNFVIIPKTHTWVSKRTEMRENIAVPTSSRDILIDRNRTAYEDQARANAKMIEIRPELTLLRS